MSRIQGIFVPTLVPFDAHGRIDEHELHRYIDWLIGQGVHGLYPNGSTGEFTRLNSAERRRIIEITVAAAAGRVPILAGAAEANVSETLAACEHYASLGVRSVAIVAPYYFKLAPAGVYAYFAEIARSSPVDITLYNIPLFASPIDVATVERLAAEHPRVVAIKDSSGDMAHMQRMMKAVRPRRPEFSFLTGWDASLLPMLLMGCDGGTNAVAGIAPELTRELFELASRLEVVAARKVQEQVLDLFDLVIAGCEFPDGVRAAVKARGFCPGPGRQPVTDDYRQRIAGLERTLADWFGRAGLPLVGAK